MEPTGNMERMEDSVINQNSWGKAIVGRIVTDEWIRSRRDKLKPWRTFFDTRKINLPSTTKQWTVRFVNNIENFQSNYMCVFIGLFIYALLTSPLLLFAISTTLLALYLVKMKNEENKVILFGRQVGVTQQYALVALMSFPLFYLAGASSAVFWAIGASFFVILAHATTYASEINANNIEGIMDLQMEVV